MEKEIKYYTVFSNGEAKKDFEDAKNAKKLLRKLKKTQGIHALLINFSDGTSEWSK